MSADDYCSLGICAAMEGHEGTCDEASGWSDEPEPPTAASHPPSPATGADNRTTTPPERESAADEGKRS